MESVRWDALVEVALVRNGSDIDDVFVVLQQRDGPDIVLDLDEVQAVLPGMGRLPGFDAEAFNRALAFRGEDGVQVLWRR
ncbi:hypothetical protein JRC04_10340 [Mycolicibacterium sp. S2-37]|uniref:hypothetical protein n=1 Tax=Mycolicibacterium sp. S2-37 TaxID=2810297 RepID=UPI001A93EAE8|nr:hypothetical protein [Mycolicibacterium sp. S2-37]MBO0677862.1 hypothetical protein [Mycolicibacterium sp. S2-37]